MVKVNEKLQEFMYSDSSCDVAGMLSENIMHFARLLRSAGLTVGSDQILTALSATISIGLSNRADFYWALHSIFVKRIGQREIFNQAFDIFWKNPQILERLNGLVLPDVSNPNYESPEMIDVLRRVIEALSIENSNQTNVQKEANMDFDASLTWSANESLGEKDFEEMSAAEIKLAISAIRRMRLPINSVKTRRFKISKNGARIDMRRSMRDNFRSGADFISLVKRERRVRRPPLVVICDISGSMERYSRMLLHFMHSVTNDRDRVHTFLFGTSLTNITRYLLYKDIDEALKRVGAATSDWSGGTKIGYCLHNFNKFWSRRVPMQGAVVILISDGLDRNEGNGLKEEMRRLHRSCRRLIWLNPLLRYKEFKPKSMGIKAMLPHVDDFRTIHNLNSFENLANVLQFDKIENSGKSHNRFTQSDIG